MAYSPVAQGRGGVLHLWGASERRLKAKHALYKVTEHLRWPTKPVEEIDGYYNQAIYNTTSQPWTYADVPADWLNAYAPWMVHLHLDAEPWQRAEVERLVHLHGFNTFRGLDLFGIV